jgi:hypothetical protein
LLARPPLRDRLADKADVDGDDSAHRRVGAAELLHHQCVRDRVELPRAEIADLCELGDQAAVDVLDAIPLARMRKHLALAELASRRADQLLLVRERKVHGKTSGPAPGAGPDDSVSDP